MNQNNSYNITDIENITHSEEKFKDNINNDSNENNIRIIYSIYKNILSKCSPKYSNIEKQIDKDKDIITNHYLFDPNFRDAINQNIKLKLFKSGFKNLFFGPEGFVTRKNYNLKKFYKSFRSKKVNFHEKLYIGSFELFDSLGNNNKYNKRLKLSQKRIIQMNGNFDMTNTNLMKMKMTYKKFSKKLTGEIKKKNLNINSGENENNSNKDIDSFKNVNHNLFFDYKNNLIPQIRHKSSLIKPKILNLNNDINFTNTEYLENVPKSYKVDKTKPLNILHLNTNPSNSKFDNIFQISNDKKNILTNNLKTENNKKKIIENYASKSINFNEYFKRKREIKKYVNSFSKTFGKKLFSSNVSNHKFRDNLNNFIIKNQNYVIKKDKYFKKKMEEPYNEFKESSKNEEKFKKFAKNVDFSNLLFSNHKKHDKINSNNMIYNYKIGYGGNIPIKDYLKKIKKKKEKEKENKILKSVRKNFKANSKVIHNLTISLDDIKKKYNY